MADTLSSRVRFGEFELDRKRGELRLATDGGLKVLLQEQPFQVLLILVEYGGEIVSRDVIQERLWPGNTAVEFDNGINTAIKKIRIALGDSAEQPKYVETLPRRGYRLMVPVEVLQPAPGDGMSPPGQPASASDELSVAVESSSSSGKTASQDHASRLPSLSRRWKLLAMVGAMVVAVVIGIIYWRSNAAALTVQDTIVLGDFTNSTGSAQWSDILRTALRLQLEQSPFLNILSDSRINKTLKLMDRPPNAQLTKDVAREICVRTGSRAILAGSVSNSGNGYLIRLEATNCQTGHRLATADALAEDANQVLAAVTNAGNQMRQKLGESLASVQRFNQPLAEVTTPSLEALQLYSQSLKVSKGPAEAIPFVERALVLDPKFALAYASLGAAYANLGEPGLAAQNTRKAYELRGRLSERERFYIEGLYYAFVTGELDKAEQTYQAWIQSYPRDEGAHNDLGIVYTQLGQLKQAAAEMQEVVRIAPNNSGAYANLMGVLASLNRFSESQEAYDEARGRHLENMYLRVFRYDLAFLQGDEAAMREQFDWAMGKPSAENTLLGSQSDTDAYYGRFRKAREFSSRAVDSARHADAQEAAAEWNVAEALREAEVGNAVLARSGTVEALTLSNARDVRGAAALALARAGDTLHAQTLAEGLSREFPLDTIMQGYTLPTIRAAILLQQDKALKAVAVLGLAAPYEMSQASFGHLYPAYVRGEVYLRTGDGQKAEAEFQKLLDHRGMVSNWVLGALAPLQLGRAQAMSGDKEAARRSYQDFFALWKDADPDIPVLRQAKSEFAKLQ